MRIPTGFIVGFVLRGPIGDLQVPVPVTAQCASCYEDDEKQQPSGDRDRYNMKNVKENLQTFALRKCCNAACS